MARILAVFAVLAALAVAACSGDDDAGPTDSPSDECLATGAVSVGSKPWAVATDAASNRLYSADEFDNTVTILDLCTHAQVAKADSGTGPNSISVNHQTGVAFVSNFNSNDVTVIEGDAVIRTIPIGQNPWSVLADSDANVAYVANSQSGSISVVEAGSPQTIDTIEDLAEPRGLARIGRTLYVAEASANRVRAIDLDTGAPAGEVAVGQRPQGLAVDEAAGQLWVTNVDDGTVSVVKLDTMSVVATIAVGLSPLQVAVDPQRHRAYTADSFADAISVIDTQSHQVLNSYRSVQRPWDVEVSESGLLIYVANSATSEILILDPDDIEPGD
jgi:YVTN family beta-propeller protein